VVTVNCLIEVLADSLYTTGQACRIGHVKLNGRRVWESSLCSSEIKAHRGINILQIDPLACTVSDSQNFDTFHAHEATKLFGHLQQVQDDKVIVGVTAGWEAIKRITKLDTDATSILKSSFGVDVDYLERDPAPSNQEIGETGSFAFIAQKDQPGKTLYDTAYNRSASNRSPAHVTAAIAGTYNRTLLLL